MLVTIWILLLSYKHLNATFIMLSSVLHYMVTAKVVLI